MTFIQLVYLYYAIRSYHGPRRKGSRAKGGSRATGCLPLVLRTVVVVTPVATALTSAAGFPANDTHSSSISLSSVVTRKSPCTILGGSGGTRTVTVANLDRIPGSPPNPGLTWHWYRASSSSITGKMSREKSPAKDKTEMRRDLVQRSKRDQTSGCATSGGRPIFGTVRWHPEGRQADGRAGMRASGSVSHNQRASLHRSMEDLKRKTQEVPLITLNFYTTLGLLK